MGNNKHIPKKPEALARWLQMADLFRQGRTVLEIALQFGVSKQRVGKCLSILGCSKRDGGQHLRALNNKKEKNSRRDTRYLAQHGCSYRQYASLRGPATRAYSQQRVNAKSRGIEWKFKFWDWWQMWEKSGRWKFRGTGQGWVMCRKGDVGAYSPDNVFIAPARFNHSDTVRKKNGMPIGVQVQKSSFSATRLINNKRYYQGGFENPIDAHAAYLRWGGVSS